MAAAACLQSLLPSAIPPPWIPRQACGQLLTQTAGNRPALHTCKPATSVLCAGHQDVPTQAVMRGDTGGMEEIVPQGHTVMTLALTLPPGSHRTLGKSTSPLQNHLPHLCISGRAVSALRVCDASGSRDEARGTGIYRPGAPREEDQPRRGVGRHRGDHLHEGAPRLEPREAASPQQPETPMGKIIWGAGASVSASGNRSPDERAVEVESDRAPKTWADHAVRSASETRQPRNTGARGDGMIHRRGHRVWWDGLHHVMCARRPRGPNAGVWVTRTRIRQSSTACTGLSWQNKALI